LNPVAIKNKELREYIIGKDDFEYAAHTNRTDDLPLKDALNLIKRFKAKRPYHGKKHYVMQAEESFHNRKFTHI
jgi:hypothetical protein